MNTILITGASGFIGKNIVELLLSKSCKIIAFLSRDDQLGEKKLREIGIDSFLFEEDLSKNTYSIDSCIHLASYGVEHGKSDYNVMINVNIALSAKILDFCNNNKCKNFINTGSCFEYGDNNSYQINENEIRNPNNLYAATKTAADIILSTMARAYGIKYISVRPFGVFGKYESEYRLLPLVVKHGMNKEILKLTKGEQIRDYLYVKDVALAYLEILNVIDILPSIEIFNICSSQPISIRQFIENVIEVFGFDKSLYEFGYVDYRENESMRFVGSNEKLIRMTNWKPKFTISLALEDYKKFIYNKNE